MACKQSRALVIVDYFLGSTFMLASPTCAVA